MDELPEPQTNDYWITISIMGGTILLLVIISAIWISYRNKMLYKKDCRQDEPTVKEMRQAGAIELTEDSQGEGFGEQEVYNFDSKAEKPST